MARQEPALRKQFGLIDLTLFNIAAVTSIRWFAAAANAGPISIFLWILAAAFFFVPSALAVSRLTKAYPIEGGLYVWTRETFGEWHGFVCGYTYLLANLFFFVSLSLAIVSVGSTVFQMPASDAQLLWAALLLIWTTTIVNVAGGRLSKWTGNAAATCTCISALALIVAGVASMTRHGSVTTFEMLAIDQGTLNLWSQMAFAFVGLELGAVLAGEIRDPKRTVPRAAVLSGGLIAMLYVLGTAAILAMLQPRDVSPITGLAQAFDVAEKSLGLPWFGGVCGMFVIAAMTGQLGAWIAGSGRLPFVIGMDRYLPPALASIHPRWRTPWISLLSQAAAASMLGVILAAGETAQGGYQLLVDMTVLLTFIPFVYIFVASWKIGLRWPAASGLLVTLMAMVLSAVPPATASSVWMFELKIIGGCLLLLALGWLNYRYARWVKRSNNLNPLVQLQYPKNKEDQI